MATATRHKTWIGHELYTQFGIIFLMLISMSQIGNGRRSCYVCSGWDCMRNPFNRDLSPGMIQCHPVDRYCTTHFRYLVKNESLLSHKPLGPEDYFPQSGTRSCAKTHLGNLCRRDYHGLPHVTCITTCESDFCNCDSRSPPPQMFKDGATLFESPQRSTFYDEDLQSCVAARASAEEEQRDEKKEESVTATDNENLDYYEYGDDYEVSVRVTKKPIPKNRRRGGRRRKNGAISHTSGCSLLMVYVALLFQ